MQIMTVYVFFLLNDPFLTNPCFNDGETADQTWEKSLTPIHKPIELFDR